MNFNRSKSNIFCTVIKFEFTWCRISDLYKYPVPSYRTKIFNRA